MRLLEDIGCLAVDLVQYAVKKSLQVPSEEQIKRLECGLRRVFTWCGFLAFSLVLLLAGMGLIIWGAYLLLASAIGSGPSTLIIGIIVSLLAIVLAVIFKHSNR